MRTNEDVLKVLLDNIGYLRTGLCGLAWYLCKEKKVISNGEYRIIMNHISFFAPAPKFNRYYSWPEGDKESRIEWLEKQIDGSYKLKK